MKQNNEISDDLKPLKQKNKIWDDLKPLVFFVASGSFAKLHKKFMAPASNLPECINQVHHWIHFGIGLCIQIILLLWLFKIIRIAAKSLQKDDE